MDDFHTPERFMPYPEIAESRAHDRPYEITDSSDKKHLPTNGMTNKVKRQLIVPLVSEGRPVSRHELGHVKWSPQRLPRDGYDPRVLMSVEDARINMGLDLLGIPVHLSEEEQSEVGTLAARDLERGDTMMFILRSIASIGTNVEQDVLASAAGDPKLDETLQLTLDLMTQVRSRLERGRRRRDAPVATFDLVKRITKDVARELETRGLLDDMPSHVVCCCLCHDEDAQSDESEDARAVRALIEARARSIEGGGKPGRMKVRVAPLQIGCTAGCGGRRRDWRPSVEGSVVRWFHRYPIDGAIFRRSVRKQGGTVLVDASGSMSLSARDLARIIKKAPTATLVAMYSGRRSTGELRIIARDGRRASGAHLRPFGSGNVVDVPALEWLAKQPTPRIWISDGAVTGVGDMPTSGITEKCGRIRRRARVQRVRTAAEAAALLK